MDSQVPPEAPVSRRSRRSGGEDSVEARRYVDALRRRIVADPAARAGGVVTAYAISSWMPDRYKATASIVKQVTTGPYESVNVEALTRELSTIEQLLLTSDVLAPRGQAGRRARRADSIGSSLESSVDPEANLDLRHRHRRRPEAGRADRQRGGDDVHRRAARRLAAAVRAGARPACRRSSTGSATSRAPTQQVQAIQQRLSELGVSLAGAGNDLGIAQRADAAGASAARRSPLRNAVIALFLGLFVGVLVALASDQLVPRVTGTRELSRLIDLPVLGTVPYVRRRLSPRPAGADRDRVRELPDARHVVPLRARGRRRARTSCWSPAPCTPRARAPSRRASAATLAQAGPSDPARLGRPALADAARARSTSPPSPG